MLYIVSGLFVDLLVLCFTSMASFTGFYIEDEPNFFFIDFFRVISEIDINLSLISIAIDQYRLSVYRSSKPGILNTSVRGNLHDHSAGL